MMQNKTIVVILFAVSLFTIAKCFYIRDEIMEPIDIARAERNKREVLELAEGGIAQPFGVRQREQTVIVVPNSGTTEYRTPYPPYGSNRGTSVVVSQMPGYNNVPRNTYMDIMPINPVAI